MDQLMDQSSGLPKNKVIAVFVGVVLLAGTGAFWKLSVDNQTASLTQQAMSSTQRLTVAEQVGLWRATAASGGGLGGCRARGWRGVRNTR